MTRLALLPLLLLSACGSGGGHSQAHARAVTSAAFAPVAGSYQANVMQVSGSFAATFAFGDIGFATISQRGHLDGWEGAQSLSVQLEAMSATWFRALLVSGAGVSEELDIQPDSGYPGRWTATLQTTTSPVGSVGKITWTLTPIGGAG